MGQQELFIVPAGLHTDPSPHGAAPPGALRTATNVVIRRAGAVEPRPGFLQYQDQVGLDQVWAILGYPGTDAILYVGDPVFTGTTFLFDVATGTAVLVTKDTGGNLSWIRGHIQAAASRKNLYLSTADALRKITSGTDITASKAGVPPAFLIVSGPGVSPGVAVPAGMSVSYRAVMVRKDVNGLQVRSAPSNRVIFRNLTAATVNPSVLITLSGQDDNPGSGNIVELYRSVAVEETPFDEHFYAKSFTGGLQITGHDDVAELDLGAALYTNDDEEGAANANMRPPQAKDVHEFAGSLFLANLTYPAQLLVQFTYAPTLTAADANGVGQRLLTGTYTNGSATVTGVASTVGFRVGQVIDESLNEWAGTTDFPRIVSLTAGTVTFSTTYTGTTGSKSKAVADSIRVNGQYFPVGFSSWTACLLTFWDGTMFGTHTPATDVYALTDDIMVALSSGIREDPNNRSLLLKAINPTAAPFVVYATHGSEYRPPLPEPTAVGLTADQDVFPSGVCWSKTFEPEHFSLVDMELIGSDRADTWRIVKGRDALWVLKVDGLWRLSGAGRDAGFRIDPVSKAKLLTPNCVAHIFDQVYIWTDQGILGLDSGANAVQSQPIRDQIIHVQQTPPEVTNYDIWLCGNQKSHELVLSLPSSPGGSEYLLIYNFLTNAWTRWDLTKRPSCAGHPLSWLEFGVQNVVAEGGLTYSTTRENLEDALHDSKYAINVTAVVGGTVTIAAGSGWMPLVGDALEDPLEQLFLVTAVTDATHFTVDRPGLLPGSMYYFALVAYQCEIEPVACTSKNPSILKLWQDGSMLWGDLRHVHDYVLSFTSSLNQIAVAVPKVVATAGQANCSHRFITPRAHARTEQVFVKLIVRNAAFSSAPNPAADVWRWQGLSLFYSMMGPRVRAR